MNHGQVRRAAVQVPCARAGFWQPGITASAGDGSARLLDDAGAAESGQEEMIAGVAGLCNCTAGHIQNAKTAAADRHPVVHVQDGRAAEVVSGD